MEIKETKLTPEILGALCKVCAEVTDDPEFPCGENCPRYKYLRNGVWCDHLYFFFTMEVCVEDECALCKFNPKNCGELTMNRCITCALKTGKLKL